MAYKQFHGCKDCKKYYRRVFNHTQNETTCQTCVTRKRRDLYRWQQRVLQEIPFKTA